jgi:hypothetical protein
VVYDEQGERYRDWRSLVQEASEHSFSDNPLDGPLSGMHVVKHHLKFGGHPC